VLRHAKESRSHREKKELGKGNWELTPNKSQSGQAQRDQAAGDPKQKIVQMTKLGCAAHPVLGAGKTDDIRRTRDEHEQKQWRCEDIS